MLKLKTELKQGCSLAASNNSIENIDDYIDYLNEDLNKISDVNSIISKATINTSNFGQVEIKISNKGFYTYTTIDELGFILDIEIFDADDSNENFWYDSIDTDLIFTVELEKLIKDHVEKLNTAISYIKHPINENLAFINNSLYMEISEATSKHTPEYVSLSIDDEIDTDDLANNLYIDKEK